MIGHRPRPARIDAGLGDRRGRRGRGQFLAPPAGRDRRAARSRAAGAARRAARPGWAGDGRCLHDLTRSGAARKRWPPAAAGAALIVGSALAFALDGPVAQAAYRQGLDPATFGFWRASAGALVLGGYLAARLRPGALAGIRRMRRPAAVRLALAAVAGLGLNLALFEAFARLPVAVAVASFGCYPLFVAAWEAVSRRAAAGAVRLGMAVVAIAGLMLLIRPDRSVSVPIAGLLLALLAAVLHAAYILLGRGGWDQVGDGAATFLIVTTAALGLGVMVAATRPAAVLAPITDPGHTGLLLLLEGALAGAAAPLLFLAGLRRIGATQTAVLSLCEPLAATLLAAVMLGQLLGPSQMLGGALLLGAGIAVQTVPARPARRARDDADPPVRHLAGSRPPDAARRPEAA
jgi:drug/metabolite transporter (DMT)-like permease